MAANKVENKTENRVAIFIDGGNFYQRIRHDDLVSKGVKFDYVKFAKVKKWLRASKNF